MFYLISGICFLAWGIYDLSKEEYVYASLCFMVALFDFSVYAGLLN